MEVKKLSNVHFYRMRIERGESIVAKLKEFMLDKKPGSASFLVEAGGGFTEVKCAFSVGGYKSAEFPDAPYVNYDLPGPHEISGTSGNIVWHPEKSNEPMVHIHTTLGSNQPVTYVAHLHEAKVMATAELLIITSGDKITRKHDKQLNLWLMDLSSSQGNAAVDGVDEAKGREKWSIIATVIALIALAIAGFSLIIARKKSN